MIRKLMRNYALLPLTACILASVFSGCGGPMSNDAYGITVINPDPRIGSIFLKESFSEFEVSEVWSKSYFQPTSLSLRHTLNPSARAVFRGWTVQYPNIGSYGNKRVREDTVLNFEISDTCWMVSPRFEWTWNAKPLWLDDDVIVFVSNRDSGDSLWKISPSRGKAVRVTSPGFDGNGEILSAHRLETMIVRHAWRGSSLIDIARQKNEGPYRLEVWDAASSSLAVSLGGSGEWGAGDEEFAVLDLDGALLWGLSKYDEDRHENAVFIVQPGGSSLLALAPDSKYVDYAANGDGHIVFGLYKSDWGWDALQLVGIRVIDARTATMTAVSAFEDGALSSVPFAASSVSNDGGGLLLAAQRLDADGVLVGASLAIAFSDGSSRMLPAAGGSLPLRAAGARFNSDGTAIVAQDLGGAWHLYSIIDGTIISDLTDIPADAAPLIGACWLRGDSAYRYHAKADDTRPGSLDRVEARANGNNVDLMLIDASSTETWLTGPASGDSE
jgi:hypothetical protein